VHQSLPAGELAVGKRNRSGVTLLPPAATALGVHRATRRICSWRATRRMTDASGLRTRLEGPLLHTTTAYRTRSLLLPCQLGRKSPKPSVQLFRTRRVNRYRVRCGVYNVAAPTMNEVHSIACGCGTPGRSESQAAACPSAHPVLYRAIDPTGGARDLVDSLSRELFD
jgi:hypothetical protein